MFELKSEYEIGYALVCTVAYGLSWITVLIKCEWKNEMVCVLVPNFLLYDVWIQLVEVMLRILQNSTAVHEPWLWIKSILLVSYPLYLLYFFKCCCILSWICIDVGRGRREAWSQYNSNPYLYCKARSDDARWLLLPISDRIHWWLAAIDFRNVSISIYDSLAHSHRNLQRF